MKEFSALLCVSFKERDKEIKEKIKSLLEKFKFQVEIFDYHGTTQDLNEEIKKKINEKDAVFISLTKPYRRYVLDEAITTYNYDRHKLFIFFEDNLINDGILAKRDYAFTVFNRENFLGDLIKRGITTSLLEFRENLIFKEYVPLYKFTELHIEEWIENEEKIKHLEKRHVKVIQDYIPVEEISYINRTTKTNSNVKIDKNSLIIDIFTQNKDCIYKVLSNTNYEFKFILQIKPGLQNGEEIRYRFEYEAPNNRALYFEDVNNSTSTYYIFKNTKYEKISRIVRQPIDKLTQVIRFPKNYKIKKYGVWITEASTSNRNEEEEKRIRITRDIDIDGREFIRMEVDNAKINHTYHLWWEPPSKEEKNLLLTPM